VWQGVDLKNNITINFGSCVVHTVTPRCHSGSNLGKVRAIVYIFKYYGGLVFGHESPFGSFLSLFLTLFSVFFVPFPVLSGSEVIRRSKICSSFFEKRFRVLLGLTRIVSGLVFVHS